MHCKLVNKVRAEGSTQRQGCILFIHKTKTYEKAY